MAKGQCTGTSQVQQKTGGDRDWKKPLSLFKTVPLVPVESFLVLVVKEY